jgi:hypothetical protein
MSFSFVDPIFRTSTKLAKPKQTLLLLQDDSADKVKVVRLLLGMADVSHSSYSGEVIQQRVNYSVLGAPPVAKLTGANLKTMLGSVGIQFSKVEAHLRDSPIVSPFLSDFLHEWCWYLLQTEKGAHTTAFIHLYRALERISYCFPMVYAAAQSDYLKTYEQLRQFLSDPETGELKFFKVFVDNVVDRTLRDATCELNFSSFPSAKHYCEAINKCFKKQEVTVIVQDACVSVEHRSLLALTITVRNRFFHFLSGKPDKYSSEQLPDSDKFFLVLNRAFANWLAVIYFHILRIEI